MARPEPGTTTAWMKRMAGGEFAMGSERHYPEEAPVRRVRVDPFWIDEAPVTVGEFARFVAATGHVTVAERAPDPADYPGMDPALAVAASLVFTPPPGPVDLRQPLSWWRLQPGADWRRPEGPDGPAARPDHPVVHIAWPDAQAYAAWAGKALPTEAEWEFAARGGLEGADYAWGDDLHPGGRRLANTFDGAFPWNNLAPAESRTTSAVRSYEANGFGLFDMIGNVWEWTADWYGAGAAPAKSCCVPTNPRGPAEGVSRDPADPAAIPRKVLKGGSHLCAPSYCQRYRPAARHPQPIDTSASHVGFRCVVREGAGQTAATS